VGVYDQQVGGEVDRGKFEVALEAFG